MKKILTADLGFIKIILGFDGPMNRTCKIDWFDLNIKMVKKNASQNKFWVTHALLPNEPYPL